MSTRGRIGGKNVAHHADSVDLWSPDAEVTLPCGHAVQMPERETTQAEAARYHARDRAALAECRGRHGLAVDWIEGVIADLSQ